MKILIAPFLFLLFDGVVPVRISDGLFTTLQGKCVGGDAALLTTGLRLTYEIKKYNLIESYWIDYNSSVYRILN